MRRPQAHFRVNNGRFDFRCVARSPGHAVKQFRQAFHIQTPTNKESRGWNGVSWVCFGKVVLLLAVLLWTASASSEPLTKTTGHTPLRPWKPTLTATISDTSIRLGESVSVTYSTENATGCMRDWTQLRPFIGRSDGIVIPTHGSYTHTPTEVGTFTTRIMATRRATQLNRNGKEEGWRRAVILEFDVEVRP